ncbi:MAG: hypothetical protein KIS94_13050 [Chitinophagales bacterium]|nr:hypothetical protein [Chitinophagales bacterium]
MLDFLSHFRVMIRDVKGLVVVLMALLLTGCNENKSREKPDVSKIDVNVRLLRFDKDLQAFNSGDFSAWRNEMINRYGAFYKFYISNFVVGPRPAGDTADIEQQAISRFLSDKYIRIIQDSISARFSKTDDVEQDLKLMFRYFKHYVPQFEAPEIITINSAYGAGVSPFGNNQLIIGLDMFLGEDNRDYDSVGVYAYLRHKMKREYIARYAAEALYEEHFPSIEMAADVNLIDAIIERGKKLYFISYLFPDAPDSMILGYTASQTKWCNESEYAIWQFLNDKDLLYKNNAMEKTRYLGEGPGTNGMPPEAPGAIGNFVGLQIVRKFMKENGKGITMPDLMNNYDAKVILAKSKYRPAKSNF